MHTRNILLGIFSFLLFFLFPFVQVSADTLVLQNNGIVLLQTDTGVVKKFLFSHEKFTNSHVLGASSGVIITVSLSSFIPTDTPVPTQIHKSSSTPTPLPTKPPATPASFSHTAVPPTSAPITTHTTPTHNPTISVSLPPTPTLIPTLFATITTPSMTTTQQVNQVTQEMPRDNPLVVTTAANGTQMLLTQGAIQATSSLPVQLSSQTKTLSALIGNNPYPIVSPKTALQSVISFGTYIIPSSVKINLTTENNQPIYTITGNQHVQIFNTFIIDFPVTTIVAANDPTKIQVKNPFFVTFFEFFHIGKRVIR